jgi:MFS family permease
MRRSPRVGTLSNLGTHLPRPVDRPKEEKPLTVKELSARSRTEDRLVTPVFLVITLATFAYFLSVGATIPVLPLFVEGPLGGGSLSVGVSVGAFAVTAVLLRPIAGGWSDARGRRLLITLGASLVAASVAAYMAVDSIALLIVLRLVTGVGEAFFYTGAASAINDLAPDHRRGEALSFFSLALYSGIAFGPVVGEQVLRSSGFDTVWIVAAASAIAAALLGILVRDTRPGEVTRPSRRRWLHPAGLLPGLVLATSVIGIGGFNSFVPLYALDLGMDGSRLVFVLFSAIVLSIRSLGARIPDRLGPSRTARNSLVASASGLVLMGVVQAPAGLFVGAAIFAVGQALAFPALMTIALSGAPASERGAVVGTFTAFFDLAFGLGAVSLGGVAHLFGYEGVFVAAGAVSAAGFVIMQRRVVPGRRGARAESRRVEEGCEPL